MVLFDLFNDWQSVLKAGPEGVGLRVVAIVRWHLLRKRVCFGGPYGCKVTTGAKGVVRNFPDWAKKNSRAWDNRLWISWLRGCIFFDFFVRAWDD